MQAKKVSFAADALLDPLSARWKAVPQETVALSGTPVQLQPSRYIRAKWSAQATGGVRSLGVRAAHDGRRLLFHLEWPDERPDREYGDRGFPDAAGILFPLDGAARLETMGSPAAPVNAWYWRADREAARNLVARGLGTVEDAGPGRLVAGSAWKDGVWRVVLGRSIRGPNRTPAVRFRGDRPVQVAFAVWDGSLGERGGIKSFSGAWRELGLER